jgi:hypothetical protein
VFGSTRSIRRPAATHGSASSRTRTDPAVLRVLLRIKPGLDEGYSWVECGSCGFAWPVPDYAEESVR